MLEEIQDLAYWPPSDEVRLVDCSGVARVLLVGPAAPEGLGYVETLNGDDTRVAVVPSARRRLHDGTYGIRDGSCGLVLLVVRGAQRPAEPAVADRTYDRNHLSEAFDTYEDQWQQAASFAPAAGLAVGDLVQIRGRDDVGRVVQAQRRALGNVIAVEVSGVLQRYAEADLVQLDGDPQSPEFWLSRSPASAEEISRTLTWAKLRHPLNDFLYSFSATRTVFKPYQFLPALKILSGSTGRILIADEVGLGKTIEAGLIWTELEQRAPINRALIVVPSALTVKWEREMRERFLRPMKVLQKADLMDFVADLDRGNDPGLVGIVSVEALRGYGSVLNAIELLRPRFDLVIIDEAHSLRNRGTKTAQLGQLLADLADHLVLLTATPLNLGSDDLFNLVNLLDSEAFPSPHVFTAQLAPNGVLNEVARAVADGNTGTEPRISTQLETIGQMEHGAPLVRRTEFAELCALVKASEAGRLSSRDAVRVRRLTGELNTMSAVLNRTRKVDVQRDKALRIVENIDVQWTPLEWDIYRQIEKFYRERARAAHKPLGFVMQMPLRQATSCIPVARRTLLERRDMVGADELESEYWSLPGASMADAGETVAWKGELKPISRDTKLEALRSRLHSLRAADGVGSAGVMPRVLIFTYFRGTVDYLCAELGREFRVDKLHGGVALRDRDEVIHRFAREEFDILVANQVGSEGLDFQFCNVLVNYDLPWNPMQVEQRIGRLDRIGQRNEKIFIFNMSIRDTIETDIIQRLYQRIGLFEESIGDLEPIMRQTMQDIEIMLADTSLTPTQQRREVERQARAVEQNRVDAKTLEDSSGLLTTVGSLEVDGLTADGPASGRYIGESELRRLVRYVTDKYGGRTHARGDGRLEIVGNAELGIAVNQAVGNSGAGSVYGSDLVRRLRDGDLILAGFRPDEVSSEGTTAPPVDQPVTDLVSARHPLVRLAVAELDRDALARPRYGRVRIDGCDGVLAAVTVIEITGLSRSRELWITALDRATGERCHAAEEAIFVALAKGTMLGAPRSVDRPLEGVGALHKLDELEQRRVQRARTRKAIDNEALTDARIAAYQHTIQLKTERIDGTLRDLVAHRRDERVLRMQRGRLRSLSAQWDRTRSDLEKRRTLVLSDQRVAILEVVS